MSETPATAQERKAEIRKAIKIAAITTAVLYAIGGLVFALAMINEQNRPKSVYPDIPYEPPADNTYGSGGGSGVGSSLASRGVTASDISRLAYYADEAGYGDGLDLYSTSGARQMAALGVTICDRVSRGASTWRGLIADDIASGAPPADARAFHQYLARTFCPNLG